MRFGKKEDKRALVQEELKPEVPRLRRNPIIDSLTEFENLLSPLLPRPFKMAVDINVLVWEAPYPLKFLKSL